jgi:hypothetical protein
MNIGKKLLLVAVSFVACPGLLVGMNVEEAELGILARCQESGVLARITDDQLHQFTNQNMTNLVQDKNWKGIAYNIIAGSQTDTFIDALNDNAMTKDDVAGTCFHLDEIFQQDTANQTDVKRVAAFLDRVIGTETVGVSDLRAQLSQARMRSTYAMHDLINEAMAHVEPAEPKTTATLSSISMYKIVLPAVALIAIAAIGYKWWSKKIEAKKADADDADETRRAATTIT